MQRTFHRRAAAWAIVAVALLTGSGCSRWFLGANALSFGAGWFLRDLTMQTSVVRECFVNDAPVDCADITISE